MLEWQIYGTWRSNSFLWMVPVGWWRCKNKGKKAACSWSKLSFFLVLSASWPVKLRQRVGTAQIDTVIKSIALKAWLETLISDTQHIDCNISCLMYEAKSLNGWTLLRIQQLCQSVTSNFNAVMSNQFPAIWRNPAAEHLKVDVIGLWCKHQHRSTG